MKCLRFRFLMFALSGLIFLGSAGGSEAKENFSGENPQGLIDLKIPKLVDQRPEAPKLVARDDYYSPKFLEVKVKAGNVISLKNMGTKNHGFIIPAFEYQGVIKPGETKKIPVPQKEAGFYDFYCPFHPNMKGTIEVLPKRS